MYEQHFGLTRPAFRITPDPEFFFPGGNRGAVLEALVYAVARGEGIVKVVGEVGSGKTMLCRMLERELPDACEIVYLANPRLSPAEILHAIAFELKLEVGADAPRLAVLHALHEFLLERHAANRRVIVFVEEAQGVPLDSLEEIRMLSNLETSQDKLLQIVLFGQPELDDKLDDHAIRQLRERITHSFELAPFDRVEVRDYVNARLRQSGYRGQELFAARAIAELERHSQGLLRRINVLADKALLAAFAAGEARVDASHVRRAARDSEFGARRTARAAWGWGAAALVAGIALLAVLWKRTAEQEKLPAMAGVAAGPAPPAAPAPMLTAPDAAQSRASDAVSGAVSGTAGEFVDNQVRIPVVSAATGLVSLDHLQPVLVPPPAAGEAPGEPPDDPQQE